MTDTWRTEYEDAIAERNVLIDLKMRLQDKIDQLRARVHELEQAMAEFNGLKQAMQELAELNYNLAQGGPNARYVYDLKQEVIQLRAENDALFEKGKDRDDMARSLRRVSDELTWTQEKARGWQNRAEYAESKLNELQAALAAAGGE